MRREPTLHDVTRRVEGRAAVTPSLLWQELGGAGDYAPLWLMHHLRRLGFVPVPAGFWWRKDLPAELCRRLVAFIDELEEAYPDRD